MSKIAFLHDRGKTEVDFGPLDLRQFIRCISDTCLRDYTESAQLNKGDLHTLNVMYILDPFSIKNLLKTNYQCVNIIFFNWWEKYF